VPRPPPLHSSRPHIPDSASRDREISDQRSPPKSCSAFASRPVSPSPPLSLPRTQKFASCLRAFSSQTLAKLQGKFFPPRYETHGCSPHAISSPKFFPNGIVARTGFAQIRACAHRTVSELSPAKERNRSATSAASRPRQIFSRMRPALNLFAHPTLPSPIDPLPRELERFFLNLYPSRSTLRTSTRFACRSSSTCSTRGKIHLCLRYICPHSHPKN